MHTDRGSEYTSDEFRTEIRRLRMRQSMGRADSCYGNAAAESWFAVLKAEIGTTVRETLEAARPTSSATSRSSATAADSADTPSMGTSPHSKREPCSGKGPGGERQGAGRGGGGRNTGLAAFQLCAAAGVTLGDLVAAKARDEALAVLRGAPVAIDVICIDRAGTIVAAARSATDFAGVVS